MNPVSSQTESAAFAKASARLVPFLFLLYVLAHIDRGNISVIAAMAKDQWTAMGIAAEQLGFGLGVFYFGYALFEVPSNLILERVGARRWIARIMITWGLVAMAMMFIEGPMSFYAFRFLLGVAEAGFMPGVIFFLTQWYPAERRAKVVASFLTSITCASVITAPLTAYIIEGMEGVAGLHGWQWVFIIQGLPSVIVGISVLWLLPDRPRDARWLTGDQSQAIEAAVERDRGKAVGHLTFAQALTQPRIWLLVVLYFLLITAFYGVGSWLPTFWKKLLDGQGISNINLGWILTIPYLFTAVVMVLWSRNSDRTGERRWHTALAGIVAALSLAGCAFIPGEKWVVLPLMTVATAATFCALGPFWSTATEYLRGSSAAGGIALVNGLGCLGGFAGPYLVPWMRGLSPVNEAKAITFDYAYLTLGISMALFAVITLLVVRKR